MHPNRNQPTASNGHGHASESTQVLLLQLVLQLSEQSKMQALGCV